MEKGKECLQNNQLIFKTLVGSHAYSTNIETSDHDYKGVYMQPTDDLVGFGYKEQIDVTKDECYYELRRFMQLLQSANPMVLEMLFVPEESVVHKSPVWDILLRNKEIFLTRKCRDSFGGYAVAQIKRAKGLNKKMNWEDKRVERKDVLDFVWAYSDGKTFPVREWLKREQMLQEHCGLAGLEHLPGVYALYYDWSAQYAGASNTPDAYKGMAYKGICGEDSNDVRLSSIPKGQSPVTVVAFNKDAYSIHCKEYREYELWLQNRNTQRYVEIEGHGQKIDCFLDSETEYLTDKGWKKYDDILKEDQVASVDSEGRFVFSHYSYRFKETYSGTIHTFENRYTRFSVTPNHRLLLKYQSRKASTGYSTESGSLDNLDGFDYLTVEQYLGARKNYAWFLGVPLKSNDTEYPLTDEQIMILGSYISDGYVASNQIRIDQKPDKQLFDKLSLLNYSSLFYYTGSYTGDIYARFTFKDRTLLNFIQYHTGKGSINMNLSPEFFKFSRRQFKILLEYMLYGDGTLNKARGHHVYYTSSKELAYSLNTLLFINGYFSKVWEVKHKGGFEGSSDLKYQVYISNKRDQRTGFGVSRHSGWNQSEVCNEYVSCFTTKYGNVVTRNNYKTSIQGNSKNLMHCRRLIDTALEIGRTGTFSVRRPNREYLLSIRKGEFDLDTIIADAERDLLLLDEIYADCSLPHECDKDRVNDILLEMRHFQNMKP